MILISPHQFADLDRENALASEYGMTIHVANDQEEFAELSNSAAFVLVSPYGKVTETMIGAMGRCQGIVRYGIGYDNIDVDAAARARIPVSIVPDASTEEVASHAFALGLALSRRIPAGQVAVEAGQWASSVPADLPKLSDLEVGIVGMGRIGRMVANLWSAVGARVRAFDPIVEFTEVASCELDELITGSDLISLHVPLNDRTQNMISASVIDAMRDRALLINVSRGGLIDETALADALRREKLGGAGLDVFTAEPLALNSELRNAPNVILTPHSAWKSRSSLAALQTGAVARVRSILSGQQVPDQVA
ncbi:MAG: C-terminal binding protein [Gulosibacter sp.]|uniref:C-terminal binding protein n=1 Tax=Gulosibacter sp. TaxID=2817531 RepID=UPI003F8E64D4